MFWKNFNLMLKSVYHDQLNKYLQITNMNTICKSLKDK